MTIRRRSPVCTPTQQPRRRHPAWLRAGGGRPPDGLPDDRDATGVEAGPRRLVGRPDRSPSAPASGRSPWWPAGRSSSPGQGRLAAHPGMPMLKGPGRSPASSRTGDRFGLGRDGRRGRRSPGRRAIIPELVIGAFGVAVITSWHRRGRTTSAGRPSSRTPALASGVVRRFARRRGPRFGPGATLWLSAADLDFVVRVYAAPGGRRSDPPAITNLRGDQRRTDPGLDRVAATAADPHGRPAGQTVGDGPPVGGSGPPAPHGRGW